MDDVIYYVDVKYPKRPYHFEYKKIGNELAVAVYLATGGSKEDVFWDEAGFPYDIRHYLDGRTILI